MSPNSRPCSNGSSWGPWPPPARVHRPGRREQLDYASFLEIILSDEVNRRADRRIEVRLHSAGFEQTCRLEDFDWTAPITVDHRPLDAAFSLEFIAKHEHVLLVGPAGVGKSFLAQALGYAAIRAEYTVRTDARAVSFASGALAHYAEDSNPVPYGKPPSNPSRATPAPVAAATCLRTVSRDKPVPCQ